MWPVGQGSNLRPHILNSNALYLLSYLRDNKMRLNNINDCHMQQLLMCIDFDVCSVTC